MKSFLRELPPPTEEDMLLELRDAAYHEAAHAVLMMRFGGEGNALVWRNFSDDPSEPLWRGQFRWWICPQARRKTAASVGRPAMAVAQDWEVLVAVAGMVAEEIVNGNRDPALVAEAVSSQIGMGTASRTDLELMGIREGCDFDPDWLDQNIYQAHRYLTQDWVLVQEMAEYLISFAQMPHSGFATDHSST